MTIAARPPRAAVLADSIAVRPGVLTDTALIAAGVAVVAVLAQVEVPMFPVPITGQTLGVLLVGAALGARRGAISLAAYLLAGLAGAPVFAGLVGGPAAVLTPSFGFVIGFIASAWLAGRVAERRLDRRPLTALLGFAAATAVPFLVGVPYMAGVLGLVFGTPVTLVEALQLGVLPFLVGGAVKAAIAAAALPLAWRGVAALDRRRD